MTTRTMTLCAALTLLVAASPLTLVAQQTQVTKPRGGGAPGQWRLLGSVEAGFTADHDTIVVRGPYDNFRKIKFKVTDAGLNLQRLVVTYDNGEPDRLDVRENIRQGGESRPIDLRGVGKRSIRKIDFWYDTKGVMGGRANVTVFGQK